MRPANCGIAPEGAPFICLSGFTALLCAVLGWWIPCLVFWLLMVFAVYFFRDPERAVTQEPDAATSPADGRIARIGPATDPFSGREAECVSVFMSVFNVHVNRAPVACEVMAIRYFPGKFLNASLDKASKDNERCAWLFRDDSQTDWTVVQIAGLIARRIVCRAEPGDTLARGERFGLIRFGSRVDLYLPPDYTAAVAVGDAVIAGQSVIARRKKPE